MGVSWQKRHPWLLTIAPPAVLPLPDAPRKPMVNGTMVAVEGETVSILCSTQSNPDPILTIFKEKQILATVIYESELQLELPAVTPEDDGEYWCVAENQYGQRATTFNLSVECEYPPRSSPLVLPEPGWTSCPSSFPALVGGSLGAHGSLGSIHAFQPRVSFTPADENGQGREAESTATN